jgi:hypothetical protein
MCALRIPYPQSARVGKLQPPELLQISWFRSSPRMLPMSSSGRATPSSEAGGGARRQHLGGGIGPWEHEEQRSRPDLPRHGLRLFAEAPARPAGEDRREDSRLAARGHEFSVAFPTCPCILGGVEQTGVALDVAAVVFLATLAATFFAAFLARRHGRSRARAAFPESPACRTQRGHHGQLRVHRDWRGRIGIRLRDAVDLPPVAG